MIDPESANLVRIGFVVIIAMVIGLLLGGLIGWTYRNPPRRERTAADNWLLNCLRVSDVGSNQRL